MKDLFKKKTNEPKATTQKTAVSKTAQTPKKPLFGKKAMADSSHDNTVQPAPASKKSAPASKKSAQKVAGASQLDVKKIIPILIGLLILVLALLLAKMFIFDDSSTLGATETIVVEAPPAEEPVTSETQASASATDDTQAEAVVNPAQSVVENALPAPPSDDGQPLADAENAVPANDSEIAPDSTLSYEEFIQETEKKVYRERIIH